MPGRVAERHKWLNVPYDSGVAFCAHPDAHRAAMSVTASYLVHADDKRERDQVDWMPEVSRRARGFAVCAALRSLGRRGVAELVGRCCAHARRFGEELGAAGATVLNDVVLNQVLVRFGDGEFGGTEWDGEHAMRVSVWNWRTTDEDVERSLRAILAAAELGMVRA